MKKAALVLLAALTLPLSGCLRSVEELYAPPKQSAEYYDLQNQIEQVLYAGAEYSAPVSGDRRQAVQLADLDSDGQEEAVVFFRTQGEKPLKIYIYKKTDAGYAEYAVIEGDGSAFASVDYRQIDTALGLELVVGRQVSDQVPQTLSVYTLNGEHVTELLSVSCIRHTLADLDGNGLQDLLVFRSGEDGGAGLTDYYSWEGTDLELVGSASMSSALTPDSIRRIVGGMMQPGTPAVFVANTYEESTIVTDVFTLSGGEFRNASVLGENPGDAGRVRYRSVYAAEARRGGRPLLQQDPLVQSAARRLSGVQALHLPQLHRRLVRRAGPRLGAGSGRGLRPRPPAAALLPLLPAGGRQCQGALRHLRLHRVRRQDPGRERRTLRAGGEGRRGLCRPDLRRGHHRGADRQRVPLYIHRLEIRRSIGRSCKESP